VTFLKDRAQVAKRINDNGKTAGKAAAAARAGGQTLAAGLQRFWRDMCVLAVAPALLYLVFSLFTYSPEDPGWSRTGSLTAPVHNVGGRFGAWLADVLMQLLGYLAFLLPVILAVAAWYALFGQRQGGGREERSEDELEPALRLIGLVGFVVAGAGFLHLRLFQGDVAQAGGILGRLVSNSLAAAIGPLGSNLFVVVLLLASITLATGLSWLALMERIGKGVMALGPLLQRSQKQAVEMRAARAAREEREVVRKVEAEVRAKREPVRIEPPAAPVVEKSERAKRATQIPMFSGVRHESGGGLPSLSLLDDPRPQPAGYDAQTLETL